MRGAYSYPQVYGNTAATVGLFALTHEAAAVSHDEPSNEELGITPVSGWRLLAARAVFVAIGVLFFFFIRWVLS